MKWNPGKILLFLAIAGMTMGAWASGTLIEEQSARASYQAGAFVARADDPSAIFFNPAGLAFQSSGMMVGVNAIRETMEWDSKYGPTSKGPTKYFYPGYAYVVYKPDLPVTFGLGTYAPHALATEWGDNWPGAAIAERTIQRAIYITPSVAFKLNDKWAMGLNLNYVTSTLYLRQGIFFPAIPYSTPPLTRTLQPGIARLTGSGHGWGWGLGVLGKLSNKWQVGFNFRDKVTIDYTGNVNFFRIPTSPDFRPLFPEGGISTHITLPRAYNIGVAYIEKKWTLEGDITMVDWTTFNTLAIDFDNPGGKVHNTKEPVKWKKAAKYKLGFEYTLNQTWKVGAGIYYDRSAVPDRYASPILPDSNRWSAQTGFTYTACKLSVSTYIMNVRFDDKNVPSDAVYVPGTYKANAWLAGVSMSYKF